MNNQWFGAQMLSTAMTCHGWAERFLLQLQRHPNCFYITLVLLRLVLFLMISIVFLVKCSQALQVKKRANCHQTRKERRKGDKFVSCHWKFLATMLSIQFLLTWVHHSFLSWDLFVFPPLCYFLLGHLIFTFLNIKNILSWCLFH